MDVLILPRGFRLTVEDPYRDKAAEREIDGPYKEGAREVRRLLGWEKNSPLPFLSTRNAWHKTGISNGTINTMANGGRVSSNILETFALKVNGDAAKLKRLFGHVSPEEISVLAADIQRVQSLKWHIDSPEPGQQVVIDDPLSSVGPDVDISAIAGIRLSPFLVSAGDGFVPPEPGEEHDTIESILPGQIRAIRVTGDCMAPLYQDGDVVFVREQGNAENGNKVIALVDEDKLNCKVYRTNGESYLEPKNGEGRIPASRFHILGVVVGVFRKEN